MRLFYLLFANVCDCPVSGEPHWANYCDSDVNNNKWKISLLFSFFKVKSTMRGIVNNSVTRPGKPQLTLEPPNKQVS